MSHKRGPMSLTLQRGTHLALYVEGLQSAPSAGGRHALAGGKAGRRRLLYGTLLAGLAVAAAPIAHAQQTPPAAQPAAAAPAASNVPSTITINEFTVKGNHLLSELDIDTAIYPYLGPGQTIQSVDAARAALQKAYADKGYQTVAVTIPPQHVTGGVVTFQVIEEKIGRLHVVGARYFSLNKIKSQAPSLAPGQVPDFNHIRQDVVALNQWPDRQVIPSLQAGVRPQTLDVNLNVKDKLPLHASLSLDDRYSANTTRLRLSGSLSYDNLWQRGDTISLSFQVAPERPADALVFSGSYLARVPGADWLTLLLYGLVSNSKVSTLGNTNVVGRGQVAGVRALISLPGWSGFVDTLSAGMDYKHFDQNVVQGSAALASPITYYPISASYSANWQGQSSITQFDAGPTFNLRGFGSNVAAFENKRDAGQSNFIYLHGDLSRQQDVWDGLQLYGKIQGQVSDQPLVNSEQFSLGGQDTVRGYLESEALGDNGVALTAELRSPPLAPYIGPQLDDWRVYLFADAGRAIVLNPGAQQQARFDEASVGVGTRVQLIDNLNGAFDVAFPLLTGVNTRAGSARFEFHVWVQY